jgi:hypothetical protein
VAPPPLGRCLPRLGREGPRAASLRWSLDTAVYTASGTAVESASSPLVGFGELNDNIIKCLISLLSVEQEIKFIAYTCGLWNDKHI